MSNKVPDKKATINSGKVDELRRLTGPKETHYQSTLRNVLFEPDDVFYEEDTKGDGEGAGGNTYPLPHSDYYAIHREIREHHKGRVKPGRDLSKQPPVTDGAEHQFADEHPLAKKAYFSGMERTEHMLPGETSDEEARQELELALKRRLEHKLGLSSTPRNQPSPMPGR